MQASQFLQALTKDTKDSIQLVNKVFKPLSIDQLNWKASPEKWSILECLEHLNMYSRFYNEQTKIAIQNLTKEKVADFSHAWMGKKFLAMVDPKNTKPQKALAKFIPTTSTLSIKTLTEFLQHQEELLQLLTDAKEVNINKKKVPVEFLRLLKMKIGDALAFIVVHQQRHVQQALRVKEMMG